MSNLKVGYTPPWQVWQERIEKRLHEALCFVADYTAEEMAKPKSGETYTRDIKGTRITWTASAPGEYPAKRTGDLIEAIKDENNHEVFWENSQKALARIVIHQPDILLYAEELDAELRPWRDRAMLECEDNVAEILGPKLVSDINQGSALIRAKRWTDY